MTAPGIVHYLERVQSEVPATYRPVCLVLFSATDAGVLRWDMVNCDWCIREKDEHERSDDALFVSDGYAVQQAAN